MDEITVSMIFRIEKNLKTAFERVAKDRDLTASQMLRSFVRNAVESHAKSQGDLFNKNTPPHHKETPKTPQKAKAQAAEGKKALLDMFKKR